MSHVNVFQHPKLTHKPYQQPEHLEHVLGQAHTAADSHFVLAGTRKRAPWNKIPFLVTPNNQHDTGPVTSEPIVDFWSTKSQRKQLCSWNGRSQQKTPENYMCEWHLTSICPHAKSAPCVGAPEKSAKIHLQQLRWHFTTYLRKGNSTDWFWITRFAVYATCIPLVYAVHRQMNLSVHHTFMFLFTYKLAI